MGAFACRGGTEQPKSEGSRHRLDAGARRKTLIGRKISPARIHHHAATEYLRARCLWTNSEGSRHRLDAGARRKTLIGQKISPARIHHHTATKYPRARCLWTTAHVRGK
jgi:hypothetical protein